MKQGKEMASGGHSTARGAHPGTAAKNQRTPVQPERRPDGGLTGSDQRWHLISEVAYYCAQARGFAPGHELEDWLQAEAEIDRMLGRN